MVGLSSQRKQELLVQIVNQDDFIITFSRSSGPGGQNVNKVNSRAVMKWHVASSTVLSSAIIQRILEANATRINKAGYLILGAEESRDQLANKQICLDKLAVIVERAWLPPKLRKKTKKPPKADRERLAAKKIQGDRKKNRRKVDWN